MATDNLSKINKTAEEDVKEYLKQNVRSKDLNNYFDTKPIYLMKKHKLVPCLPKKKPPKRTNVLSRKQKQAMGLYNIPKKSVKYINMLNLHKLWSQYLKQHLNLNNFGDTVPNVGDNNYAEFSLLMTRMDFHGSKITVIRSTAPQYVGLSGICIVESMKCFTIVGKDDKIRVIPKMPCVFRVQSEDMEIFVFGKHIITRPADRSVKKRKQRMTADL